MSQNTNPPDLTPMAARIVNGLRAAMVTGLWRRIPDQFLERIEARRPVAGGIGDEHTDLTLWRKGRTITVSHNNRDITMRRALEIIADPYSVAEPAWGTTGDNGRPIDTREVTLPMTPPLTAKFNTGAYEATVSGTGHGWDRADITGHIGFLKRCYQAVFADEFAEVDEALRHHHYRRTGEWQRREDLDSEWRQEMWSAPVDWIDHMDDEFELWAGRIGEPEPERVATAREAAELAEHRAELNAAGAVSGIYQHLIRPEGVRRELYRRNLAASSTQARKPIE